MICVQVILAFPDHAESHKVTLSDDATVADAVEASGLQVRLESGDAVATAVFGHRVEKDFSLQDGDRIELLRPLQRDPRVARRELAERGLDVTHSVTHGEEPAT